MTEYLPRAGVKSVRMRSASPKSVRLRTMASLELLRCCRTGETPSQEKRRDPKCITSSTVEATSGFEPLVGLLQSPALPLGDVATGQKKRAGDGDRTRDFLLGKEMLYH